MNKLFLYIACTLTLLTACSENPVNRTITIIKTDRSDHVCKCLLIVNKEIHYCVNNYITYKNDSLIIYAGCGGEGLYILNFEENTSDKIFNQASYEAGNDGEVILKIKRTGNIIDYLGKRYKIETISHDSIFVKSTEGESEYIIFVGSIPTE